jgi:hypothetical protein
MADACLTFYYLVQYLLLVLAGVLKAPPPGSRAEVLGAVMSVLLIWVVTGNIKYLYMSINI